MYLEIYPGRKDKYLIETLVPTIPRKICIQNVNHVVFYDVFNIH